MGPDTRKIGPTRGRFNGRFKKFRRAGLRSVGECGALGLYGKDYINGGARHGEGSEAIEPRGQKAEASEIAEEGRRVGRSGKVAKEVVRRLGNTVLV
jgi:hypothetical protein